MKLVKLTPKAFEYYRTRVKGNKDITLDQANRKLTRNIKMAKELEPRNDLEKLIDNKAYLYGNLLIVVRKGKVVYLKNKVSFKEKNDWKFDLKKYIKLSQQLGIA